jgi:D-3-phosphoglycerate dehydrogenase
MFRYAIVQQALKQGAILINNSRGTVVDLDALASALRDQHLSGAAIDVFPAKPSTNATNKERFTTALQGLPNVILTPHIGGSTEEAQERIGAEVARKLVDYSDTGSTTGAVNFPQVQLPARPAGETRYMHVHRNVPGMLGKLNQIFSGRGVNVTAQYLQTDGEIGYVVVEADVPAGNSNEILDEMRAIEGTIRARVLHARGQPG